MSMETASETGVSTEEVDWAAGGVAGFLGGIPFGFMVQFVVGAMGAVGALYGMPGIVTGWAAHLFHSVVFGVVFAAVAETDALGKYTDEWLPSAGVGLVYGVVLWAVFILFVWPVWLGVVGFPPGPKSLPVPYVAMKPLVGHLVYGAVLGALYPFLRERI